MGTQTQTKLWSRNFIFIILINFFVFMNHIMTLTTFPFFIQKLGGSDSLAGTAALLFSLVAVVCRPFIGWMLDSGKRRAILVVGLCGMALMPFGFVFVPLMAAVLVLRMIHGAALSFSNTATATIASDIIPGGRFAEGMGFFGTATALASAGAPALALALMNWFGFTALYVTAGCMVLLALGLFLSMRIPSVPEQKKPLSPAALFDKNALPASAVTVVFMLTFGALENFLAKFAAENGLPSGALYFLVMAVMLFLTRITVGKVADSKGEGPFVYTCNACMFVSFMLLAFVPGKAAFFVSAVLSGYAFGGLEPALQSMAVHSAPVQKRGSANSTFLCAYDIGWGLGGGLAGWLIDGTGYPHMWAVIACANSVSVLLYVCWGRNHPSSFSYARRHPAVQKAGL